MYSNELNMVFCFCCKLLGSFFSMRYVSYGWTLLGLPTRIHMGESNPKLTSRALQPQRLLVHGEGPIKNTYT